MARVFALNGNLTVRVEIYDPDGESEYIAYCTGCAVDILGQDFRRHHFEDCVREAERHADVCAHCADPDCRVAGVHLAGFRCRKTRER